MYGELWIDPEVIKTSDDGQYRVILIPDTDCERPMDSGDWWTSSVLTRSRRSDEMETMYDPQERLSAWQHFANSWHDTTPDADEAFKRYMHLFHGIEVYDVEVYNGYRDTSSGLAWTEPSEAERVGFTAENPADSKGIIDIEISEHNAWAEGDCYGYIVQKRVTWATEDDDFTDRDTWEDTDDSCWGFIGHEYAEDQAKEALAIAG